MSALAEISAHNCGLGLSKEGHKVNPQKVAGTFRPVDALFDRRGVVAGVRQKRAGGRPQGPSRKCVIQL